MVDQNVPHHLGCHSKKVRPILPRRVLMIYQTDECLVDERRSLQGVTGIFAGQVMPGQPPQLSVNERNQLI